MVQTATLLRISQSAAVWLLLVVPLLHRAPCSAAPASGVDKAPGDGKQSKPVEITQEAIDKVRSSSSKLAGMTDEQIKTEIEKLQKAGIISDVIEDGEAIGRLINHLLGLLKQMGITPEEIWQKIKFWE